MVLHEYIYEIGKVNGKSDIIKMEEKKDGLYIYHERKNLEKFIGNFKLEVIKKDDNENNSNNSKTKYWFDVYLLREGKQPKKMDVAFFIYDNESVNKTVASRLKDVNVERDRIALEYLNYYVWYLINHTKPKYQFTKNESNTIEVKKYLIKFMELIHGKETEYIESDYCYNEKNKPFYEENKICSNKDLFLHEYSNNRQSYEKIGYVDGDFYYIHLPKLIQFMEKENRYQGKMESRILNIGLHKLKIMALPEGKNTKNVKSRSGISMNLTKLYVSKLLDLAFPSAQVEPISPEEELVEQEKEEIRNDIENDNYYDYDEEELEEEEEKGTFDDILDIINDVINDGTTFSPSDPYGLKKMEKEIENIKKYKKKNFRCAN